MSSSMKTEGGFFWRFRSVFCIYVFSLFLWIQNEETNGHFQNVEFMCADVTSPHLRIEPGSKDIVFSNWLLMYLSDEEVSLQKSSDVFLLKYYWWIIFHFRVQVGTVFCIEGPLLNISLHCLMECGFIAAWKT